MGCEADFANFGFLPFSVPFDPIFVPTVLPSFPKGSCFDDGFEDDFDFFVDMSAGLACCFMEGVRWVVLLKDCCLGGGALDWVRRGEGETERSRG